MYDGEDCGKQTLHELLASILLEKSLMLDRPDQVVDHQAENRQNLFFGVIRIMNQVFVLIDQKN
jgi:hypothetical protein